ncbi:MAG: uroporphyrinogen-III synthase [Steroidobacteraceae bacterium]
MSEPPTESDSALRGRTIAIAEARELPLFTALLERRGARVLAYPLVTILDAPDPAPVRAWLRGFAAGGCDDLVLLTGEGLRRLHACVRRHDPALEDAFLAALRAVRKLVRGPKPARALRELGMQPELQAEAPTTAGVVATLATLELAGRRVGVQLYGEPNPVLVDFLRPAGAVPLPVAPYVYAAASDAARVQELLQRMRRGEVDAIAFTSKAQVQRLFQAQPAAEVHAALASVAVAAIGPVVAEALAARGIDARAMPPRAWFMKPLAAELARVLGPVAAGRPPLQE